MKTTRHLMRFIVRSVILVGMACLVACAPKYYDDMPPLINELDLQPGRYRITPTGVSVVDGKIQWLETYPLAKFIPDCQQIILLRNVIYCTSHRIRVKFNPKPWDHTGGYQYLTSTDVAKLRLQSIVIIVHITEFLGTTTERHSRFLDNIIYEYEAIPIKSLRPNFEFEFE